MDHRIFAERLHMAMREQNVKQVDLLRAAEKAGVKLRSEERRVGK